MRKIPVLLLAAAALAVSSFSAEKVFMPFFELINVHPDYQYSTARLFKGYVDEAGRYELIIPERQDSVARQPASDAVRKEAQARGCAFYLIGDLNRIGETVIFNVALYSAKDGARVWGDKLKASTPEDLDPILQKVARAVGSGEKAAADGDIYSVTSYEGRELRQVRVRNAFGVAVGGMLFTPGLLTGESWDDPFIGGLGLIWTYDARSILFELDGETYFTGRKTEFSSVSISAFKPFASSRLTPFAGGGLGLGNVSTESGGETVEEAGLLAHVGGGFIFNRTSNVQLRAQVRYQVGLFKMDDPVGDLPRGVLMRMELAFGK